MTRLLLSLSLMTCSLGALACAEEEPPDVSEIPPLAVSNVAVSDDSSLSERRSKFCLSYNHSQYAYAGPEETWDLTGFAFTIEGRPPEFGGIGDCQSYPYSTLQAICEEVNYGPVNYTLTTVVSSVEDPSIQKESTVTGKVDLCVE